VDNVLAENLSNLDVVFTGKYSTATDSRTIENLGELEFHFGAANWQNLLKPMETELSCGESLSEQTKFVFLHREKELEDIPNTSPLTSLPYTQAPTGKSLNLIRPFGNEFVLSTMSLSTSSANSDILRRAISTGTARRKRC